MITTINLIKRNSGLSVFQALLLSHIEEILSKIDLGDLSDDSYIEVSRSLVAIALIHREDSDSKIILNILENYATLWYGPCDLYFDNYDGDFNTSKFKDIYVACLLGKYQTKLFYLRKKLIFSSTKLSDFEDTCLQPNSLFYRFYIRFYYKHLIIKHTQYKSFIK